MLLDRYRDELPSELFGRGMGKGLGITAVPVDITEAARMFLEDTNDDFWDYREDFPTIVSPWDLAWYEWRSPAHYRVNKQLHKMPSLRFGAATLCCRVGTNAEATLWRNVAVNVLMGPYACSKARVSMPEVTGMVEHAMGVTLFAELPGRNLVSLATVLDCLDEQGKPLIGNRVILSRAPGEEARAQPAVLLPLYFAISLLHCKNVSLTDKEVPEKLQRARRRRGKPEKTVYKMLEIDPMKRVLRGEGRSREGGLRQAMHICRGHFKDYRKKGMFGKETHKGIYWWDMHVRGDADQGKVIKGYKIV